MAIRSFLLAPVLISLCLPTLAGTRPMPKEDPNLDPNWDWTRNEKYVLYSSTSGKPVETHTTFLPYFSQGNLLCVAGMAPDMAAADGWALVHRDFGTPRAAQPFPYFTLYNRHRGIFRVMVFNATNREGSYFIGQLYFGNSEPDTGTHAALMTFGDPRPEPCHLDGYDPGLVLSSISRMTAHDCWAVFDFPLVGYDPRLDDREPIVMFRLIAFEQQDLELKTEGQIQMFQAFREGLVAQPAAPFHLESAREATLKGYSTYKSVSAFLQTEVLSPEARRRNGDKDWFKAVQPIAASKLVSYLPYVAALGSVIDFFIGGAAKSTGLEPLNFTGQLHLDTTGYLRTRRDLLYLAFFLNPGPTQEHIAQRPLRRIPWGVVNFRKAPVIDVAEVRPYERDHWRGSDITLKLAEAPGIVVNPECAMDPVSTRVAFTIRNPKAEKNPTSTSPFMTVDEARSRGYTYDQHYDWVRTDSLLWEFRFRVRSATLHSDPEIVILKRTGFRCLSDEKSDQQFKEWRELTGIHSLEDLLKKGMVRGM